MPSFIRWVLELMARCGKRCKGPRVNKCISMSSGLRILKEQVLIYSYCGDMLSFGWYYHQSWSLEMACVIFLLSNIWMSSEVISQCSLFFDLGKDFPFNLKMFLETCLKCMTKSGGIVVSEDGFISQGWFYPWSGEGPLDFLHSSFLLLHSEGLWSPVQVKMDDCDFLCLSRYKEFFYIHWANSWRDLRCYFSSPQASGEKDLFIWLWSQGCVRGGCRSPFTYVSMDLLWDSFLPCGEDPKHGSCPCFCVLRFPFWTQLSL